MTLDSLIFDEDQIISFLESVSRSKALECHLKIYWKEYDESAVLNFIYTVMWWKGKPGTVEVDLGDQKKIEEETANDSFRLLESFVQHAAQGAQRAVRFLETQEQIRNLCQQTISDTFREARSLNAEIMAEVQKSIAILAVIKCASTITLKGAALAGGGLPAFLIGAGYDLTLTVIKDWKQSASAKAVAVTSKSADKIGKKVVKDVAKNMANIYKQEESAFARKAKWLQKRLSQAEEELTESLSADRMKKLAKDSRKLARARDAAARARLGYRVLTSVKFLFFAKDTYDAIMDARQNIIQSE